MKSATEQLSKQMTNQVNSFKAIKCAQHSVQPTSGSLRDFWQLSTPRQDSAFKLGPRPAHLRLTQTVSLLIPVSFDMSIVMRIKTQLLWTFLLVLTACNTQSAPLPVVTPLSTPTTLVLSPSATEFATATPSPTLTPTPTAIKPPALEDIKWSTYEFPAGVSFEYPTDWLLIVHNQEYFVEFTFPYFPWNVSVYIFERPLEDKAMADPHTWNSKMGELLWERPISIENANGREFIYGTPSDNQISGLLIANYYSEKHALEARFYSVADMIPTESDKFAIFEHMIQSVRIAP